MSRAGIALMASLAGWSALAGEPQDFEVDPGDVRFVELTLFLGPGATRRLEQATARTYWHELTVTVNGVHAFTATTYGVVSSGTMSVRPSPALLTELEAILRARARGEEQRASTQPDEPARIDVGAGDLERIHVDLVLRPSAATRLAETTHTVVGDRHGIHAEARLADRGGARGLTVAIERVSATVTDEPTLLGSLALSGTPELLAALRDLLAAKAARGADTPPR
jgi:hypothetical protein